jgi:hypothetical protein
MGSGTNVQDRLIALHDLDVPWRPSDLAQRLGRLVRQGNTNPEVEVFRYVTEGTFDAYSYQLLENKQKPISQIMSGKSPARKCADVDEASLSYSEVKTLCTGDSRLKEVMEMKAEISRLTALQTDHINRRASAEDIRDSYKDGKSELTARIAKLLMDCEHVKSQSAQGFEITLKNKVFADKTEAGKALGAICDDFAERRGKGGNVMEIGNYRGFVVELRRTAVTGEINAVMRGEAEHFVPFTTSAPHNLRKLETAWATVDKRLELAQESLYELEKNYKSAQEFLQKPFRHENELKELTRQHTVLSDILLKEEQERRADKSKSAPQTNYFSKSSRDAFAVACASDRAEKEQKARESAAKQAAAQAQSPPPGKTGTEDKEPPEPGDD